MIICDKNLNYFDIICIILMVICDKNLNYLYHINGYLRQEFELFVSY